MTLVRPAAADRTARCPTCGAPVRWQGNAHRPFCSLDCRLIDLGVWLDERYRIPGKPIPTDGALEDRMSGGG